MSARKKPVFDAPELYFNRELSALEFQRRVLAQAADPETPLLERLRFLAICSGNLDEFFEIRVAGLKQQLAFGIQQSGPDGLSPGEQLLRISEVAHEIVAEQYRVGAEEILPALRAAGLRILRREEWNPKQQRWKKRFFREQVLPVLTPMALDPAHPFPQVLNKGLAFIVSVEGKDAFGRTSGFGVIQVPRSLPRLIRVPENLNGSTTDFVMLSSIIHAHVDELFPGMSVTGCYQFRVTRNSDLWVDEEEVEDLLQAMKGELLSRKYGEAVRLEVAENCSPAATSFLLEQVGLSEVDLYRVNGPVNLHRLAAVYDLVERPEWKYPSFVPGTRRRLLHQPNMFEVLNKGDVLLHHPYESFTPFVELIQQAAADPDVLAIKQTLYRTDSESPVVQALLDAARAGKEVTVVVEVRARFDEARNIDLATQLQAAGATVVYGVVGYKCHAKLCLIVRREGARLRLYSHLGTGNYHAGTVRAYTDFGLMTANRIVGEDVQRVFTQVTGLGKAARLRRLLQSPFSLHKTLLKSIAFEAGEAKAKRPAGIRARMNSLSDPSVIEALYAASSAGVKIDLLVRGICRLRPGVPGVSENIRVRSVVGRFLEHSRVFSFHAGGEEKLYLSSADWMERNLHRRVETAFPVEDARSKARVLEEALDWPLSDNVQAWELKSDGTWVRRQPGKMRPRAVQKRLVERHAASFEGERSPRPGKPGRDGEGARATDSEDSGAAPTARAARRPRAAAKPAPKRATKRTGKGGKGAVAGEAAASGRSRPTAAKKARQPAADLAQAAKRVKPKATED